MKAHRICSQIIDYLIDGGYRHQVRRRDIEKAVMHVRGIDPRTFQKWLKALETFEYIKLEAPNVWKLNPFRIPELLKIIREKPQSQLQ